jgi:tetratricopeptide (TPR) repeat protein
MGWLLGFIVTWALALVPVLILRYSVLKRTVGQWPAVAVGILTAVLHVVVFVLLGAKHLGPVSALVGYVAYGIMRGRPFPFEPGMKDGGPQGKGGGSGGRANQGTRPEKEYHPGSDRVGAGKAIDNASADAPGAQFYAEGCRLADEGQNAAAVEAFAKCVETNPACTDAWHNKGCCLYELGRLTEAVASYSQALELRPRDSATLFARGLAREAAGDADGAASDFDEYLRRSGEADREKAEYARSAVDRIRSRSYPAPRSTSSPAGPVPSRFRAESGSGDGAALGLNSADAKRTVLLRQPGGVHVVSVTDFLAGVKSGQISGEGDVISSFLFGDGKWRPVKETRIWRSSHGMTENDRSPTRESTRVSPAGLPQRSRTDEEDVQTPAADEHARRLLLTDPDVWLRKGLVLKERNEWCDAKTCLNKALALKPNDSDALFGLAQAEDAMGEFDSAKAHYGQFLVYTASDDTKRIEAAQRRLREMSESEHDT